MNSLHAFALISILIWLKVFAVFGIQAVVRQRSKRFGRPEDAAAFGGEAELSDHPTAVQAQLAIRNDVENLPFFALVLLGFCSVGGPPSFALAYGGSYLVFRTVHSAAYIWPKQPLRNRAYSLALTAHFALAGHLVWLLVQAL